MHSQAFTVAPADRSLDAALRRRIDEKTKPPGSLGRLEELALRIGRMRGSPTPTLDRPHIVVFAGDHGAARAGISAFPQEVTWQMVMNFLAGGAAINVFARANGLGLTVVDAGVVRPCAAPGTGDDETAAVRLIDARIAAGTASYLDGPAMSADECRQAIARGAGIVDRLADEGCEIVGFGEMGIGNTASAALITHCLSELPLAECVGRGTGLDDAGLARKTALLRQALDAWPERTTDPLAVLARYGGFEIVMMTGAMLAAARRRMPVLVDGFICGAAALAATRLAPAFADYAVFCHASAEHGHRAQLRVLGASPLLALDLRLGEGTGAALAWPLVRAAAAFLNEMASFADAGVSEKT